MRRPFTASRIANSWCVMLQRLQQRFAGSLLAEPQFRRLWFNFFVSEFGARVSAVVLPLLAVSVLQAGPLQMGVMVAVHAGAFGVSSLLAGVIADRMPPKRLLLMAQAAMASALLAVPVAYVLGWLRIEWLYALEAAVGAGLSLIVTAGQVYAARLVGPGRVVDGYSLIFGVDSVAGLLGPGIAGWLVGMLSPAWAVAVESISIAVSIVLLLPNEELPVVREPHEHSSTLFTDLAAGWRVLWDDQLLRLLTIAMAAYHILLNGHTALHVLLGTSTLGLSATVFGMVVTVGGIGALVGSFVTAPASACIGERRFMPMAIALLACAWLAFAAIPQGGNAALLFSSGMFAASFAITSYGILFVSIRQVAAPQAMLGRIASTTRFVAFSVAPLGGVAFGWLAEHAGMRIAYALMGILGLGLAIVQGWALRGSQIPGEAAAA